MVEDVFAREVLRDLEVKGIVRDDDDVSETGSMGTSSFSMGEAISRQNLGLQKGLKRKNKETSKKKQEARA